MKFENIQFKFAVLITCLITIVQSLDNQNIEMNSNDDDAEEIILPIRNKNIPDYSCRNKEDDGYYEHVINCHKYWHCLYVDTIFERAFERKCPIGTMFHPLLRSCEISTMLTCMGWKRSIFGQAQVEKPSQQSLEIIETSTSIQTNDYNHKPKSKNRETNKKLNKPIIFKAFFTTSSSPFITDAIASEEEEYINLVDSTQVPFETTAFIETTTARRLVFSVPIFKPSRYSNSRRSTQTTTSTSTTTTPSSTTQQTKSTLATTIKPIKKLKHLKNRLNKTSTTTSTTTTTTTSFITIPTTLGTIEERIKDRLSFLSSNKLNSTQIFNEIETIKVLFNEQAKQNSTTVEPTTEASTTTTTTTTTTTSTTTSTTISTTTTTTTKPTTTTTIETIEQEDDDYDYQTTLKSNHRDFLPLIFLATTPALKNEPPTLTNDYAYEDEEQDYDLNKSRETLIESSSLLNSKQSNIVENKLKTNDFLVYDPIEAAIASNSIKLSSETMLLTFAIIIFQVLDI